MTEDHEIPEVGHGTDEAPRGARDVPLVERVRAGDHHAFGELYDRWFDRVFDLAYRVLYDENAAADVAQDAFLSAWRNLDTLDDANAFGGWLLRITRNAALDRKRKDQRSRPVDETQLAMIERTRTRPEDSLGSLEDPARVAQDASYAALLWDAADALGERDRDVLDLQLRHGLSPAEIADVVGLNRNAANQLVHRVRQRLGTAIGARVLWRGGEPVCAALRAELVAANIDHFDADAVRVADRHAAVCEECGTRRRLRLDPARLFAAIPILSLPSLQAKVAHALAAEGVPMEGSAALGGEADGRPRRVRRLLIAAGLAALVIVLVLIISAIAGSDDQPNTVSIVSNTSTSSSTTTRSSSTTTSSSTSTSTTTTSVPVVVPPTVPPTAAPTTTIPRSTTTTIPVSVTFELSVQSIPAGYLTSQGPVLSWRITGVSRVHVYDNEGVLDADTKQGNVRVCPATGSQTLCTAPEGDYTYTLDAFNAAGTRILHRTKTLHIS
jgi:RNA polymerase sigma factor (sigma-70 family)